MYFKKNFKIGKNFVGEKHKCLIIVEISGNHNNNFSIMKNLLNQQKIVEPI